jgi:hypothetical protein
MFRSRGKTQILARHNCTRNHTKKNNNIICPFKYKPKHYLPFSFWNKKNSLGFDISEVAFELGAGGTSSISGLFKGKFHRVYTQVIQLVQ